MNENEGCEYLATINLHDKQKEVVNKIGSSKAKYHVINASRQSGKSVSLTFMLYIYSIQTENKEIMFISPVHQQNKKIYTKAKQVFSSLGLITSSDGQALEIYMTNGNHIQFRSAERYDNIRGESIDLLFVDEFSFVRKDAWESAIRPVTAARKNAKVILASTPKGHNLFYDLALLGQDPENENYEYHEMSYADNPYFDEKEVSDARKTLPENVFATEYLAQFIADGLVFRNIDLVCVQKEFSDRGSKFYAGLDWAQASDYTVLTILNEFKECVLIHRVNKKPFQDIVKEIADILNEYNPIVYVESNMGTINAPLVELLEQEYSNIYPFKTNNDSKTEIIELLVRSMDDVSIKLPSKKLMEIIHRELSNFSYEYSPSRRTVKYSAPSGLTDDCVISIALANACFMKESGETIGQFEEKVHFFSDQRW